ncbi:MAG: metalloregulator ArsR/SmtB family transcription factor [Clostridiaceae bacterium]
MKLLNLSSSTKTTYEIHMKYSSLWECALGIAASTYDELHHTLEKSGKYWKDIIEKLPSEVEKELMYSKKHNTWKTLLQLLNVEDFTDLNSFLKYIRNLEEGDLRFHSLPFLGIKNEEDRKNASIGNKEAMEELMKSCSNNKFFPSYIEFICNVPAATLKNHLEILMKGWYEAVIKPDEEYILSILKRDIESKNLMKENLSPEKFVEWATGGRVYLPEPTITNVLLIPQYSYRPWTVEADNTDTKIFYYPVSDESIENSKDAYAPDFNLIQGYKALGDEMRLRIIKLLYEEDRTLQELTEKLSLAKSTVHHHLAMLRSVRLVKTVESKYQLNIEFLFLMESELKSYLER